jgi:nitrous oxidase accessory protein NosD
VYYSGWEINEGSTGNIVYDFENEMVTINHNLFENSTIGVELDTIKLTQ